MPSVTSSKNASAFGRNAAASPARQADQLAEGRIALGASSSVEEDAVREEVVHEVELRLEGRRRIGCFESAPRSRPAIWLEVLLDVEEPLRAAASPSSEVQLAPLGSGESVSLLAARSASPSSVKRLSYVSQAVFAVSRMILASMTSL